MSWNPYEPVSFAAANAKAKQDAEKKKKQELEKKKKLTIEKKKTEERNRKSKYEKKLAAKQKLKETQIKKRKFLKKIRAVYDFYSDIINAGPGDNEKEKKEAPPLAIHARGSLGRISSAQRDSISKMYAGGTKANHFEPQSSNPFRSNSGIGKRVEKSKTESARKNPLQNPHASGSRFFKR